MAERMSGNATNLTVSLLIPTATETLRIRLIGSHFQLKILALMNTTRLYLLLFWLTKNVSLFDLVSWGLSDFVFVMGARDSGTRKGDTFVEVLRTPLPAAFRINSSSVLHELDVIMWMKNFDADFNNAIANDLDDQRCNLLIHQTKRMCTPNLIVTNNEAQNFPGCRSDKNGPKASEMKFEPQISQLLFDRVLCDVPCSGDGTLRKAPDMNPGKGNGLHSLQIQIALREQPTEALVLLLTVLEVYWLMAVNFKPQRLLWMATQRLDLKNLVSWKFMVAAELGFLAFGDNQGFQGFDFEKSCYGDCSVIAFELGEISGQHEGISLLKVGGRMILRKCGGSVELVDVYRELPQLVRRPGVRKWKVRDKDLWLASHKDVSKFHRYHILHSMFPSGKSYSAPGKKDLEQENGESVNSEDGLQSMADASTEDLIEEVSDLPLERCVTAENSGMEPDSIDAAVEKNYELASEADLIVNEPDEAAMEPDLSNISDQNDSEEA
ncbi:hypothetical protein POTOM_020798 [Populus tomentosa]|uniref:SAM-dependent methyltransferase RsmB-F/NOP2-type catalytic core domain-containing protein n=1 Tax=Populus tomentosa TaxID=118781 RepID=A0A8X7ZQS5_POPTO|nr:hypothetical protein POTOM_020798 [Populus tomentosa]